MKIEAVRVIGLAAVAALVVLGFALSSYRLGVLSLIAVFAVATLAQNLLSGYAEIPSLGNVTFFAASAYTTGSLITLGHVPPAVAIAGGIAASVVLGLVIGLPALRISGMHLAIATVALVFVAQELMLQWDQAHGQSGVAVNAPGWLLDERNLYIAGLVLAFLAYALVHNLLRSKTGRALQALADNSFAASAVGINVVAYRLQAFVLSGALTGAAGILYLYYSHTVTPYAFPLDLSLAFLTMMIVGGTGSLVGSVLGALLIGYLPEVLRALPAQIGPLNTAQSAYGIYAVLLLLVLRFFPQGLWNAAVGLVRMRAGAGTGASGV